MGDGRRIGAGYAKKTSMRHGLVASSTTDLSISSDISISLHSRFSSHTRFYRRTIFFDHCGKSSTIARFGFAVADFAFVVVAVDFAAG